jgi:hypothetical protein
LVRYNISESGYCARTLSAKRLGYPREEPPIYLTRAAREGVRHEQWIREDLPDNGWRINPEEYCKDCGRTGLHVNIDSGSINLVGHADGIAVPVDNTPTVPYLVEIKALGKTTFGEYRRHRLKNLRRYRYQITGYQHYFKMPILFVVKARDTGELLMDVLEAPPNDIAEVIGRLEMVETYVNSGSLAPCDAQSADDKYSCTRLCSESSEAPREVSDPKVVTAVHEWRLGKILETEGKEQVERATEEFTTLFQGQDKGSSVVVDGLKITMVPNGFTTKYDVPAEIKAQYEEKVARQAYLRMTDRKE